MGQCNFGDGRYVLRCSEPTELYLTALQPTKRGAWCRTDRKKSYRLGDVCAAYAYVYACMYACVYACAHGCMNA